ncbi:AgmX/PglI C-terminal domain-containing protein [Marinobacter salinisoli]|uniref:AgmX/PglI C-terminal domain-containing protein n=1 Tax=Marinobacter salinisoli TaxID=2769486 RepID=A0ABX7MN93_9GAMM|nr:AgmX/PglI C-terminal domain-containing protein [Marinobacter salinisoli]QSP93717.1 AgmX/PglI C-terminal domain-containing protein [Marinobacter salinisoli]
MANSREIIKQASGLPWSSSSRENRRFGLILGLLLLLAVPPALMIPMLEVPEIERSEAEKIPPQLARLVERAKPISPPPLPETAKPEPEPEPVDVSPPQPEPVQPVAKPEPKPEPQPTPKPAPAQTVEQARQKASQSGLLAMKDRLASLRSADDEPVQQLTANTEGSAYASEPPAEPVGALKGSGGVQDSALPNTQVRVEGHDVKKVQVAKAAASSAPTPKASKSGGGERAMSGIRQKFYAQQSALYSLYRRELRQDPTLEGTVLLELVIEPDGSVSDCQVVSSELDNPALEKRIAMRVRLFNFGSANVETRRVRFPLDFLPG